MRTRVIELKNKEKKKRAKKCHSGEGEGRRRGYIGEEEGQGRAEEGIKAKSKRTSKEKWNGIKLAGNKRLKQ